MAKGNVLARAVHVMQFHQQLCDLQHMLAVCRVDACRKNIGKTNDKKAKGSKGKKDQKGSKRQALGHVHLRVEREIRQSVEKHLQHDLTPAEEPKRMDGKRSEVMAFTLCPTAHGIVL